MIPANETKLAEFEEFLTNQGYSPRTIYSYKNTVEHLFQHTAKAWQHTNQKDTESFKTAYRKAKFNPNYVKQTQKVTGLSRQVSALRSFFEDFL